MATSGRTAPVLRTRGPDFRLRTRVHTLEAVGALAHEVCHAALLRGCREKMLPDEDQRDQNLLLSMNRDANAQEPTVHECVTEIRGPPASVVIQIEKCLEIGRRCEREVLRLSPPQFKKERTPLSTAECLAANSSLPVRALNALVHNLIQRSRSLLLTMQSKRRRRRLQDEACALAAYVVEQQEHLLGLLGQCLLHFLARSLPCFSQDARRWKGEDGAEQQV